MATDAVPPGHVVRLVLAPPGVPDPLGGDPAPLSVGGRWQAEELAVWLEDEDFNPDAILCSHSHHAHEHAKIVSGLFPKAVSVNRVTTLTPHAQAEAGFAALRRETGSSMTWTDKSSVICIGSEDRLDQLEHTLTGTRPETPWEDGQVLWIEGDSWDTLEAGRGRIFVRTQPQRHKPVPANHAVLQPKIQSKVQTSALLAGFTSAVFGVVLTESSYWDAWKGVTFWPSGAQAWQAAAIAAGLFFLAFATLLFVLSIYMYDRLAMPQDYWARPVDNKPPRHEKWRSFRRDRARRGELYAHMLWVWRSVFSVAVGMAMLGFLALVLHRGVWLVAVSYVFAVVCALTYYLLYRPELADD